MRACLIRVIIHVDTDGDSGDHHCLPAGLGQSLGVMQGVGLVQGPLHTQGGETW